jgi:hypothetical protein
MTDLGDQGFGVAHAELRRTLVKRIARRVGKSVDEISVDDASSEIPLAELYQQKLRSNRLIRVVERLFRWWS